MGKKLYVGNLPFSSSEEGLSDLFAESGQVESVKIVRDRDTGRSKGFGFVEMASDGDAESAISRFNGYELEGRALKVSEARPMEGGASRGPRVGGGRSSSYGGGRPSGGGYGRDSYGDRAPYA